VPVRTPHLAAILLLLAVLAAGCGSGDETSSSSVATTAATTSDEGAGTTTATEATGTGAETTLDPHIVAEQLITAFLTSSDTEAVCASLSPPLLGETYGDAAGCRNGRPASSLAKSVAIDDIEVDGEQVTATAKPKGGVYDGAEITFTISVHGDLALISAIDADVPVGP